MDVAQWQTQLRRQFGRAQAFKLENIGEGAVFSEFLVTNPKSATRYRVAIRGAQPGENFCACPDFATNDLGTCKHIEFILGKLERKPGGKKALARHHHGRLASFDRGPVSLHSNIAVAVPAWPLIRSLLLSFPGPSGHGPQRMQLRIRLCM